MGVVFEFVGMLEILLDLEEAAKAVSVDGNVGLGQQVVLEARVNASKFCAVDGIG